MLIFVFLVDFQMAQPPVVPVVAAANLIDINTPTPADFVQAIARLVGSHTTARYNFMGANGQPIDNTFVLNTIRQMFQDLRLPWLQPRTTPNIALCLREIGVVEHPIADPNQAHGFTRQEVMAMNGRISAVHAS